MNMDLVLFIFGLKMNPFRLAGDFLHLFALIILIWKIWKNKSCIGISGRSQILFALVYTTRYTDLFTNFVSVYNTVMKIVFVSCSYSTLFLIYHKFKATYNKSYDILRIEYLLIPTIIMTFVVNHYFEPLEVLWTFSIYLESVAILPQMFMVLKTKDPATTPSLYLFCLGSYRGFYILNWVYRYYYQGFYDLIASIAGLMQTLIYCVFFFIYIITKKPAAQQYFLQNLKDEYSHSDGLTNKDFKPKYIPCDKLDNVKKSEVGLVTIFGCNFKERLLGSRYEILASIAPEVFSRNYKAEPAEALNPEILLAVDPKDAAPGSDDDLYYKKLCSDLEQPLVMREEVNSKMSSQPTLINVDLKNSDCLPENIDISNVGVSSAQHVDPDISMIGVSSTPPVDPDSMKKLAAHFSATPSFYENASHSDKIVAGFNVKMGIEAVFEELTKVLNKHGYCWQQSGPGQVTITIQDSRKKVLIFKVNLIILAEYILVDFENSMGDEMELQRHFSVIKESLSHIIPK